MRVTAFVMIILGASNAIAGNCTRIVSSKTSREWRNEAFIVTKEFKTPSLRPGEQKLVFFTQGKLQFEVDTMTKKPECWFRIANEAKEARIFEFKKGDKIKLTAMSVPEGIADPKKSPRVVFSAEFADQKISVTCSNDAPEKDFSPITYKSINDATAGYLSLACPGSK